MDEDLMRLQNMSQNFAETILTAYKRRFPTTTKESITITINSLLTALMAYLNTMEAVERANATDAIIQSFLELKENG
jgi:hypothetical protein